MTLFSSSNICLRGFLSPPPLQNQDYLKTAFDLAYSVLRLSDEIARRAALSSRIDPACARTTLLLFRRIISFND